MWQRMILLAVIIGAAYWYWSGPYQEKVNPSYEAILKQNEKDMAQCIRGAAYHHGTTGSGVSDSTAREQCAQKYNVYESGGHWHSYDAVRRD